MESTSRERPTMSERRMNSCPMLVWRNYPGCRNCM
jgi:hypothetical protein